MNKVGRLPRTLQKCSMTEMHPLANHRDEPRCESVAGYNALRELNPHIGTSQGLAERYEGVL